MSASSSGALKAYIEGLGLGISVFRDQPSPTAALPYVLVSEAVSITPDPAFNPSSDDEGHVRELVQIDLWQQWRDDDGRLVEEYDLADELTLALRGTNLPTAPTHVSGILLLSVARLPDLEKQLIHTAYSVEIRRVLARSGS